MSSNISTVTASVEADEQRIGFGELPGPDEARPVRKAKRASGFFGLLLQNRKATVGAIITVFYLTLAVLGPYIAPYDATEIVGRRHTPPSLDHWFGTDGSGKDVFSQTVVGSRLSLATGLIVGGITTMVGIIVGMSAGFFRGKVDDLLTTLTNIVLIIPGLPLLLVPRDAGHPRFGEVR